MFEKVQEELLEFNTEVQNGQTEAMAEEFGDLLFSMINYARFLNIDPENALERTNKKFMKRFMYLEQKAQEQSKSLKDMTLSEMEVFWQEAKSL